MFCKGRGMKLKENDKVIIFFIKYAPIIFVILLSLFSTKIVLNEKERNFKNEVIEIEKNYYETNKKRIKEEVLRVQKYIQSEKEKTESLLKQNLKTRVYEAHTIATKIYERNKDTKSKEEIVDIIKTTLGSIIFNDGRGYYFLTNKKGKVLLQPLNPSVEGSNLSNFKDIKGYAFMNTFKKTIEEKSEKFDSYYWYRGKNKNDIQKKISFIKYFEPYEMIIGAGEYLENFEENLKTKMLEHIQTIRFGNNAYIFVIDFEGVYLAHYKESLIGKNRINFKNKAGRYLVQDVIDFALNNKGEYMTYIATLNTDKDARSNKKISYMQTFDEYKWIFGTGFYTEALNNQIQKKKDELEKRKNENIEQITTISVIITAILLIISFFISKVLEKRLEKYKNEIQKQVLENKEKDDLMHQQSKMATMGEMIANIAHQWRQPLNQISAISTGISIKKDLDVLDENTLKGDMDNINKSVQYLSETIDDFRHFFSPEKNAQEFIVSNTIEKTLKLVEHQFKINDIQIIKDLEEIQIQNYENELLQVLINLLKNAQEALLENNKDKEKLIFIKTAEEENQVIISIKDNAGGIKKEIIENIFDSYFTTKGKKGTGLGLYMSKNIITQSVKGKLEVKNVIFTHDEKQYIGAQFSIVIPMEKRV